MAGGGAVWTLHPVADPTRPMTGTEARGGIPRRWRRRGTAARGTPGRPRGGRRRAGLARSRSGGRPVPEQPGSRGLDGEPKSKRSKEKTTTAVTPPERSPGHCWLQTVSVAPRGLMLSGPISPSRYCLSVAEFRRRLHHRRPADRAEGRRTAGRVNGSRILTPFRHLNVDPLLVG